MASELDAPFAFEDVTVPALVGYGTDTSVEHAYGARWLAERLPYGQQKLVALGRLVAGNGELLLLDEPTSGLSPGMVEDFCARARRLAQAGKTILLIEHNVEIVMRLSDWIVVMHQGGKIAEGPPDAVRSNNVVMHAYLGLS